MKSLNLANLLLIIATGLTLVLLWQLRSLLVILMVAVVMAATLSPSIRSAENLRLPRWLAVLVVYLGIAGILTGAGLIIGPTLVEQIQRLSINTPTYLENLRLSVENFLIQFNDERPEFIREILNIQGLTGWVIRSSQSLLIQSFDITKGIVGGVLSFLLAIIMSGYMVADSENLIAGLVELFPHPWNDRLAALIPTVSQRMGGYIQGRLLVSAILGIATTFGLGILGLSEFALALGAIAGFTNLIPFFGPILGAIPAVVVAVSLGGWTFLWVILLFAIIQNLEAYVLDPLLVGSSVKIHPLYQLLAVLGGTQVLGIVGAVIVPPWLAGASVLLENLYIKPKQAIESQLPEDGNQPSRLTVTPDQTSTVSPR